MLTTPGSEDKVGAGSGVLVPKPDDAYPAYRFGLLVFRPVMVGCREGFCRGSW